MPHKRHFIILGKIIPLGSSSRPGFPFTDTRGSPTRVCHSFRRQSRIPTFCPASSAGPKTVFTKNGRRRSIIPRAIGRRPFLRSRPINLRPTRYSLSASSRSFQSRITIRLKRKNCFRQRPSRSNGPLRIMAHFSISACTISPRSISIASSRRSRRIRKIRTLRCSAKSSRNSMPCRT